MLTFRVRVTVMQYRMSLGILALATCRLSYKISRISAFTCFHKIHVLRSKHVPNSELEFHSKNPLLVPRLSSYPQSMVAQHPNSEQIFAEHLSFRGDRTLTSCISAGPPCNRCNQIPNLFIIYR